jgi:hypothetical protein
MDSRVIGIILVAAVLCWAVYSILRMRKEKQKGGKFVRK